MLRKLGKYEVGYDCLCSYFWDMNKSVVFTALWILLLGNFFG